jgi:cysteinyl-tRNA synthetase
MSPCKVNNILDLVGNTPLIRINRLNPVADVEILVKLESMNPGGSVKDRIALRMIEEAEAAGLLTPGKILLEASSGNTAIGLAMVCAVKGYQLLVTMSESASEERRRILKAYGAKILLTPGHLSTDGAIEEAYRLAREAPDKYVLADQFNNEANWRAHYDGTGKEIWEATGGKVDVVVLTMGTTGTLMGTTRVLKELDPRIRVVGIEPFKGHKIQGLKNMKESYPPGIFKPEEPHAIVNVDDESAFEMARRLAKEEGIFVGMSAGAAMQVAVDEAQSLGKGTVVALLPDGGERYLSTSLFVSETVPEPLRFHNTLTGKADRLEPVSPGKVSVYSCGPSLDGPPDLGLCRRLVFADVLRRYLEYRGYEVKHALNLGDIDDRTINECLKAGGNLAEFTAGWEQAFFRDLDALRVKRAHHYPRASQHVSDMVEQTRGLLERGLAYEKLRSVYFKIASFPEYGKLSGVAREQMRSESSTTYDYYEKDHPQDFALFKRSTLAELKAGIFWRTPWGSARPGWHVECSCMAAQYLGQPFDIHTASQDLTFPHGDNEIAIACGLHGKPLANIWLHSEVVMADGKKVSRAAGNALTLEDLTADGFDGRTVRYWLLATHYRTVLRYSRRELERAAHSVGRLNEFAARLRHFEPGPHSPELDQALYEARTGCQDAMDHDLNVPTALGRLFAFLRHANRSMNDGEMDADQVAQALDFLKLVNRILDVIDFEDELGDTQIQQLIDDRNSARQEKDFQRADALRQQLQSMGVQLIDTPSGTRWKKA